MLVLSRRIDERIVIGSTVTVTVLEIHGDRVKLGISAPTDVPVYRMEVKSRIERERRDEPSNETHKVSAKVSARVSVSPSDRQAGDLVLDQD